MISAPLTVVCSSGQYIAQNDLTIPKVASLNLETPINLAVFADNCHQGKTLFNAQLNSRGQNAKSLVSDFLTEMLGEVTKIVDSFNVTDLVKLPSLSAEVDKLGDVNFVFDSSKLDFGTVAPGLDLKAEAKKVTDAAYNVTVTSIDSDLGDVSKLDAAIETFNSDAKDVDPAFSSLTRTQIFDTYIKTNTSFDVSIIFAEFIILSCILEKHRRWDTNTERCYFR